MQQHPSRARVSRLVKRRSPNNIHRERTASNTSLHHVYVTHSSSTLPRREDGHSQGPQATNSTIPPEFEDTYGLTEMRDSFFDATFSIPVPIDTDEMRIQAEETLPLAFRSQDPLSIRGFLPQQWRQVQSVVRRVLTTRSGIKLLKTFAAFYIAYVLCLVPSVRDWLGRYHHIMPVSTIIVHPGRTVGAQIDGICQTTIGTATGLAWGALGLYITTTSTTARDGYGGVLATFLFLYTFVIACLRSYWIRTYQGIIAAGIAVAYTCLAEVPTPEADWTKLLNYAKPWLIGQGIALAICLCISPDAGARPLAVTLRQSFGVILEGLNVADIDNRRTRRRLAATFVSISQAYRDLVLDISITRFEPKDVFDLRNLIQNVIRSVLSLQNETRLFETLNRSAFTGRPVLDEIVIKVDDGQCLSGSSKELDLMKYVASHLADPTETLLNAMRQALRAADAVLMDMSGLRQYLGPSQDVSNDVSGSLVNLRRSIMDFTHCQDTVLASDRLPAFYGEFPELVKLFAFCRPVHQIASTIEALLVKINHMQQQKSKYPKFHWPTYPLSKSLYRNSAQVRHDRGGVTAGAFFRTFHDITDLIQKMVSQNFQPLPQKRNASMEGHDHSYATMTADELEDESSSDHRNLRHDIWKGLHRLQGFETRFGLKTAVVSALLSIPAWLPNQNDWWNKNEAWWAVVMAWLIMGPRTGGNIQDLFMRTFCALLGAVWAGVGYAVGSGNPYVAAAFCLIYMPPMLYRFTQSSHARSGLVGCITFTTISVKLQTVSAGTSIVVYVAIRGGAIAVGVAGSILVNWILWPFIARHDLRKGMSAMVFYSSIIYRSIVSKYVYYETGKEPNAEDIEASERLEGRLREGLLRLRQIMGLTRHEIRLRAPFDPLPYSGLIDALERFFEHIVSLRQASLFYHPQFIRDNTRAAAELLPYRRDAIAAILTNLYVLSGALRANRKVPKYLPSAAAARAQLIEKSRTLQTELDADAAVTEEQRSENKKWSQIYSYSYNESLTGCVEQLEELERYTKAIVGEQGFDNFDCAFMDHT